MTNHARTESVASLLGLGLVLTFFGMFLFLVAQTEPWALLLIAVIVVYGALLVKDTPDTGISG